MLKRILAIFILCAVCILPFTACSNKKTKTEKQEEPLTKFTLEKQSGKDFKILQLTDIQIIDPSSQPYPGRINDSFNGIWADKDKCAFNLIKELVNETKPDYIVLTGDNVYGQFDGRGTNFKALVKLMESFQIPWSFVNGNHDGEYEITDTKGNTITCGKGMQWQGEYAMQNTKYCLYELGNEEMGYGNYTVLLTENKKPVYSFSFFDTHGCLGYDIPRIYESQTDWFKSEITKINESAKTKVPNFIFLHIPLFQFSLAMNSLGFDDIGVVTEDGYPNEDGNYGKNCERVSYITSYTFWDLIKELDCTKGIFAGHDHVNNSSIMYEGIRLTFGTKTGIYDYHNLDQQGGTLITIKDDGNFSVEPIYKK